MIEIKKGKEPKELIQYRKQNNATYDNMLLVIKKKYPSGSIKEYCLRLLEHYRNDDPKKPYVGILIYWLEKHCK